jgi:biopolymer transport protein ExbB
MNITSSFLDFTLFAGAEWVMWILVALSVLSVGVMIERGMFFGQRKIDLRALENDVRRALDSGDVAATRAKYKTAIAMPAVVAMRGLAEAERGIDAASEAMNSAKTNARTEHENHLAVLGTLGNNAPFIGLFGTVLGIITAFSDLANTEGSETGADVVMSGISEALVATAVGLMVAIPAVIAFNYFNRRVRSVVTQTDALAHVILGELHGRNGSSEGGPYREPA